MSENVLTNRLNWVVDSKGAITSIRDIRGEIDKVSVAAERLTATASDMEKLAAFFKQPQAALKNLRAEALATTTVLERLQVIQRASGRYNLSALFDETNASAAKLFNNLGKNTKFADFSRSMEKFVSGTRMSVKELESLAKQVDHLMGIKLTAGYLRDAGIDSKEINATIASKFGTDVLSFISTGKLNQIKDQIRRTIDEVLTQQQGVLAAQANLANQKVLQANQDWSKRSKQLQRDLADETIAVSKLEKHYDYLATAQRKWDEIKKTSGTERKELERDFSQTYGADQLGHRAAARRAEAMQEITNTIQRRELQHQDALIAKSAATQAAQMKTTEAYEKSLQVLNRLIAGEKVREAELKASLKVITDINRLQKQYGTSTESGARAIIQQKYGTEALKITPEKTAAQMVALQGALNQKTAEYSNMMRGIHSTWRGVAASFGQIWLAWGNFAGMAAGLALGGSIAKSISAARELGWQMEMVGVAAQAGRDQIDQLRDSVLRMGSGGSLYTPTEMASALRVLAQAGLDAKEALTTLPTTLKLSLVAEVNTEDSALFLAGMRSAFNLNIGEELTKAADQTAKAAAESQTSIEQMMDSLRQASSEANKFGLSVADTSTVLALLAKHNITGSAAGTAAKNLLTDLSGRTDRSRKALEALGLTVYNSAGMVKPFTQIIAELQEKFKGMTDQDKQKWMRAFLNERGMRAANVILNETNEEFMRLYYSVQRAGENMGYTNTQAQLLANTAEGMTRSMKASWESTFAITGSRVEDSYKGLMKQLTALANSESVRNTMYALSEGALMVAQGMSGVVAILSQFPSAIAGVVSGLSALAFALPTAQVWGYFKAWKAGSDALAAVTEKGGVVTRILNSLMGVVTKHPIVTAVTALATIGGALYVHWTSVKQQFMSLEEMVKQFGETAGAVSNKVYEDFNKIGRGMEMDKRLGLGFDVETYNKLHPDSLLPKDMVLTANKTLKDFESNLGKVKQVSQETFDGITKGAIDSETKLTEEQLEQRVMVLDRTRSILTDQYTQFTQYVKGKEKLSEEEANLRVAYEKEINRISGILMQQRRDLAIQQLRDIAAEAQKQIGFIGVLMGQTGLGGEASSRLIGIMRAQKTGDYSRLSARDKDFAIRTKMQGVTGEAELRAAGVKEGLFFAEKPFNSQQAGLLNSQTLDSYLKGITPATAKGAGEAMAMYIQNAEVRHNELSRQLVNALKSPNAKTKEGQKAIAGYEKQIKDLEVSIKNARTVLNRADSLQKQSSETQTMLIGVTGDLTIDPSKQGTAPGSSDRSPSLRNFSGKTPEQIRFDSLSKLAESQEKAMEYAKTYLSPEAYAKAQDAYYETQMKLAKQKDEAELANAQKTLAEYERALKDKRTNPEDLSLIRESIAAQKEYIAQLKANLAPPQSQLVGQKGSATDFGFNFTVDNQKARYVLGGKSLTTGIDCSGFVMKLLGETEKQLQRELNDTSIKLTNIKVPNSEGIIKHFGELNGYLYKRTKGSNIDISKLRPGMVMGLDTGTRSFDKGRELGTDHIVQIVANAAGKLMVAQSSSKKGVNLESLDTYLKRFGNAVITVADTLPKRIREKVGNGVNAGSSVAIQGSSNQAQAAREKQLKEAKDAYELKQKETSQQLALLEHQKAELDLRKLSGTIGENELKLKQVELETTKSMHELELEIAKLRADGASPEDIERARTQGEQRIKDRRAVAEAEVKAQTDWKTGLAVAYRNLVDDATNYGKFAADAFGSVTSNITSAMENLALTGKLKFREMTVSILQQLAKIAMQMAMLKIFSMVGNAFGLGVTPAAHGRVFDQSGVTPFARGGVVNSPTYFGFAGGTGLMGEQGAEAVVPLTRMANGDLGIAAQGLGGMATVVNAPVTVEVTVNSDGSTESRVDAKEAKALGDSVKTTVLAEVSRMLRPGGLINQAIKTGGAV